MTIPSPKLLKAYYIKNVNSNVPRIHDLLKLSVNADLELTDKQKDFLDEVTTFNIKARYPDYKYRFHQRADL